MANEWKRKKAVQANRAIQVILSGMKHSHLIFPNRIFKMLLLRWDFEKKNDWNSPNIFDSLANALNLRSMSYHRAVNRMRLAVVESDHSSMVWDDSIGKIWSTMHVNPSLCGIIWNKNTEIDYRIGKTIFFPILFRCYWKCVFNWLFLNGEIAQELTHWNQFQLGQLKTIINKCGTITRNSWNK